MRARRWVLACLLTVAAGCEPGPDRAPVPAGPAALPGGGGTSGGPEGRGEGEGAPAEEYRGGPVENGGRIVGRVGVQGSVPARRRLRVDRDVEPCGGARELESEELVVSADGGLRWAVVRLERIARGKPLDALGPAVLDNRGCVFVPHVLLAPVRAEVEFKNSDPVAHTVDAYPRFNTLGVQLIGGSSAKRAFEYAETFRVECQIHKWMSAFLWVCDHPYHAVTREDGTYELTDVPPGTWVVRAWAEFFEEEVAATVTVEGGKEARADFLFPLK